MAAKYEQDNDIKMDFLAGERVVRFPHAEAGAEVAGALRLTGFGASEHVANWARNAHEPYACCGGERAEKCLPPATRSPRTWCAKVGANYLSAASGDDDKS